MNYVFGDEVESILRGFPKPCPNHCCHNEGVPIDVLDHFFQEKEAPTETPNDSVENLVVGARPLDLIIEILHAQPSQLRHGKDEGSHRHRAKVISQGSLEGFPTVGVGQTWIILVF